MQGFYLNNAKTSPFPIENSITEAVPGVYLTANSVYVVIDNKGRKTFQKNGENIYGDQVYLKSNGLHSQLSWEMGKGQSSFITKYFKQLSSDTLLDGFTKMAERITSRSSNTDWDRYMTNIKRFLENKDLALPQLLPEFREFTTMPECEKYKIYESWQYGSAALYVETAKQMGNQAYKTLLADKRFVNVLFDMSIDSNGIASEVEKIANQGKRM